MKNRHVLPALNGGETTRVFENNSFHTMHLLIPDVSMPFMSGKFFRIINNGFFGHYICSSIDTVLLYGFPLFDFGGR